MNEFELISRYFATQQISAPDIILGIGDDCALIKSFPAEHLFAMTTDTLVEQVHFDKNMPSEALGHKALAVNLSDLAACAATPRFALLSITLPSVDENWLQGFAQGFFKLAQRYQVALIGGDTTRGPLSVTIQLIGQIPQGQALTRAGAKVGDDVYVTGELGGAAAALRLGDAAAIELKQRLYYPEPRVDLGIALRKIASAAIDISDGLLQDLRHICIQSDVGAKLESENIPLFKESTTLSDAERLQLALSGGDDYELCFSASPAQHVAIMQLSQQLSVACTKIGKITAEQNLSLMQQGQSVALPAQMGFQHFD